MYPEKIASHGRELDQVPLLQWIAGYPLYMPKHCLVRGQSAAGEGLVADRMKDEGELGLNAVADQMVQTAAS